MNKVIDFHKQLFSQNFQWFRKVLVWFGVTFIFGSLLYYSSPDLLKTIAQIFEEKFGLSPALDLNLAKEIFINNFIALGFALFGGILLGLGPFLVVGVNGFIFGYIVTSFFALSQLSFFKTVGLIFASILPHGVFELLAFFIAGALGLRLGLEWLKGDAKGMRLGVLKNNFLKSLCSIPFLIFLLFVAALIEVFVTGNILNNL